MLLKLDVAFIIFPATRKAAFCSFTGFVDGLVMEAIVRVVGECLLANLAGFVVHVIVVVVIVDFLFGLIDFRTKFAVEGAFDDVAVFRQRNRSLRLELKIAIAATTTSGFVVCLDLGCV